MGKGSNQSIVGRLKDEAKSLIFPVSKDEKLYVKYKENGKEADLNNLDLTISNGALYVGKIPCDASADRIYNRNMFKSAAKLLLKHLAPGELAQIYFIRGLSKLCNGTNDLENHLSEAETVAYIQECIVSAVGTKAAARFQVTPVESTALHKDLFTTLEMSWDKEEQAYDLKSKLSSENKPELSILPTTFEVAQYLYYLYSLENRPDATDEQRKASQNFRRLCEDAVPSEHKPKISDNEDLPLYALLEVAIRLVDILQDRHQHGGVDRQHFYDKIINQLLFPTPGNKVGSYTAKEITELREKYKDKNFHTFNIDTKNNYYAKRARQTKKQIYSLITTLLGCAVIAGITYGREAYLRIEEKEKEHQLLEYYNKQLKDLTFRFEHKFPLSKEENGRSFKNILSQATEIIQERYLISQNDMRTVVKLLAFSLLRDRDQLTTLFPSQDRIEGYVDRFLVENEASKILEEIRTTDPFLDVLPHVTKLLYEEQQKDKAYVWTDNPQLTELFTYREASKPTLDIRFYSFQDRIFADGHRSDVRKEPYILSDTYTHEAIYYIFHKMRKKDINILPDEVRSRLFKLDNQLDIKSNIPEHIIEKRGGYFTSRMSDVGFGYEDRTHVFYDSVTQKTYELLLYTKYGKEYNEDYIAAKEQGEIVFTTKMAKKIAKLSSESFRYLPFPY